MIEPRKRFRARPAAGLLLGLAAALSVACAPAEPQRAEFAGSRSCKGCHERFYRLWSTSFHGLAMRPYSRELAAASLSSLERDIAIGPYRYRADLSGREGWMLEDGPEGPKRYKIEHALGGKNVFYFLTPMERGRLQTLPLAYDVRRKEWFDMAGSGMRHFPDRGPDAPVGWRDWPYTFNTACHGCHVSQISTNYDPVTDSYHTSWLEPGINCETCHGPSAEHGRLFESLPEGAPVPAEPRIISIKKFTPGQRNESCSSCHAKASALTAGYLPGERFFDHFDLVTLESADYYPDGRDLGENYTYTSWMMSPCWRKSDLDCVTCHTSSGRYRFKDAENPNDVCLPCHKGQVADPAAHTHHEADGAGSRCIACHMPVTEFARMRRSDHSMRPPAPAATVRFKSPNACNGCHQDRTPEWADQWVRRWDARDHQAPLLRRAELIEAARGRDWRRLPEMLDAIAAADRDEITANSLIRLLRACDDERVEAAFLAAMNDPSPLVRSSAAESLGLRPSTAGAAALAAAASDGLRVVRVRAGQALAGIPDAALDGPPAANVKRATDEYLAAIMARPDQWTSHYNLGNYHLARQDYAAAVAAFETALRFDATEVPILVNLAIARARRGDNAAAEQALRKALALEQGNAEANFNLGLLDAEMDRPGEAEAHLRKALARDPQMAPAAYNLCVLLAGERLDEALGFCRTAAALQPRQPRYAWTHAYYLNKSGDGGGAAAILEKLVRREPGFADGYLLLAEIHASQGRHRSAEDLLGRALGSGALGDQDRIRIEAALLALRAQRGGGAGRGTAPARGVHPDGDGRSLRQP